MEVSRGAAKRAKVLADKRAAFAAVAPFSGHPSLDIRQSRT
jgi:hypothetical protein